MAQRHDTKIVRLNRATHRLLKVEAAKRGVRMNDLAAEAVRAFLAPKKSAA